MLKKLKSIYIIFKHAYMGRRNDSLYGRNYRSMNVDMTNMWKKGMERNSM